VLEADDVLTIAERREVINAFVKEIHPIEDGLKAVLRPPCDTESNGHIWVVMYQRLSGNLFPMGESGPKSRRRR